MANDMAELTMYGANYAHTAGVAGEACGIKVKHVRYSVSDCFKAVLSGVKLDATEFSLANFLMLKDRKRTEYVAAPIFPYRAFRHNILKVSKESPLISLDDLRGRRVAVPDYSMTAAVWTRGLLSAENPGLWNETEWIVRAPQRFPLPPGIKHRFVDLEPEEALLDGEADALLSPEPHEDLLPLEQRRLRLICGDRTPSEQAWLAKNKTFLINHLVVVHQDTLLRLPNAIEALQERFSLALEEAIAQRGLPPLLSWPQTSDAEVRTVLGADFFNYGASPANCAMLEDFASHLHRQKLVSALPNIREIFRL